MEYLTTEEAAKLLRVSARTMKRKRADGTGPIYAKIGNRILYNRNDIKIWLEMHSVTSTHEAENNYWIELDAVARSKKDSWVEGLDDNASR